MKVNLTLLLSNDADIETLPDLPSEDDMVNAFHLQETEKDTGQSTSQRESDNDVDVMVNELCIVIWDDKPGQRNWYVGMCRSKDEETYEIEHMERVNMRNNKQSPHERWRWPQDSADIQTVLPIQVLPCNVIGSWDTSSSRNITFVLDNWHIIDGLFQSFYN